MKLLDVAALAPLVSCACTVGMSPGAGDSDAGGAGGGTQPEAGQPEGAPATDGKSESSPPPDGPGGPGKPPDFCAGVDLACGADPLSAGEHSTVCVMYTPAKYNKKVTPGPAVKREYAIVVPGCYDGKTPLPVLMYLHASGETAPSSLKRYVGGTGDLTNKECFIWIAPNSPTGWNDAASHSEGEFARETMDAVQCLYKADVRRSYVYGWSAGGWISTLLGLVMPDKFAAFGVFGAGLGGPVANLNPCDTAKKRIVPVWAGAGESDGNRPAAEKLVSAARGCGWSDSQAVVKIYPGGHNDMPIKWVATELWPFLRVRALE